MANKSSKVTKKELSCDVSKALDSMKYGYEDIKTRVQIYKIWQEVKTKLEEDDNLSIIVAGSKAEGVSHAEDSGSDFDLMGVIKTGICLDKEHISESYPDKVVLEMVTEHTSPGYTRLRCKNWDIKALSTGEEICVKECYGQLYLSHLLSTPPEEIRPGVFTQAPHVSGPAYSRDISLSNLSGSGSQLVAPLVSGSISMDGVPAISCICTEHLEKWKDRIRSTNWPGQELIEEISQMNGHVVPVGNKGSKDCNLEWRICYTEGEIKLIHSMNEIQLKLYVLLKMVAKKILKPISSDISSYIIKNVLFWLVERTPADRFKPENLLDLMEEALEGLYKSIQEECLSNYMIPERNLLAGRLSDEIKGKLLTELHHFIHVQAPLFFIQHKDFQSLKSAVEQVQNSQNQEEIKPWCIQLPKSAKEFLKEEFEDGDEDVKALLDRVLSEFTEEQLERNISDIHTIFGLCILEL